MLWSGCSSAHYHCKSVLGYRHFSFMYEISCHKPLLKKPLLDPNVLKHFRLVSNLPIVCLKPRIKPTKLADNTLYRNKRVYLVWIFSKATYTVKCVICPMLSMKGGRGNGAVNFLWFHKNFIGTLCVVASTWSWFLCGRMWMWTPDHAYRGMSSALLSYRSLAAGDHVEAVC